MLSFRVSSALRTPVGLLSKRLALKPQFYSTTPSHGERVPGATYQFKGNEEPVIEPESADATEETYPEIKRELFQYRDPDAPWDDKQNRRNYGEPLNIDDDEVNMWSPHHYNQVSDWTAVKWQVYFFGTIGIFSGICYLFFYPERNAVPRSFPDGLAKDLGARSEDDAFLYKVRTDKTFYEKQ